MRKQTYFTATFLDECKMPIASLCGDLKFLLESYVKTVRNSLEDKTLPECVKTAVKNGSIVLNRLYCAMLHDNDMLKNYCISSPLDICFLYKRISDLNIDDILLSYSKQFDKITKYEQLNFDSMQKFLDNQKKLDEKVTKENAFKKIKKERENNE